MGPYRLALLCSLIFSSCVKHKDPEFVSDIPLPVIQEESIPSKWGNTLYTAQSGNLSQAFVQYKLFKEEEGVHDFEFLRRLSFSVLDHGRKSYDAETQFITLFGAGLTNDPQMIPLFDAALRSSNLQVQLASLHFLGRMQHDAADDVVQKGLGSNYLMTRLETAYLLANKKHPAALGQVEALLQKVDEKFHSYFPALFAMIGGPEGTQNLRKLLRSNSLDTRIAAIHAVADFERDDLIPEIRSLSLQVSTAQQEACARVFGDLKDSKSTARLLSISTLPWENARIAAADALLKLGYPEFLDSIKAAANARSPYGIAMCGEHDGTDKLLVSLTRSGHAHVRLNAAMALLRRKNPKALPHLMPYIVPDNRDLGMEQMLSKGKVLRAWKIVNNVQQVSRNNPLAYEAYVHTRENIVREAMELPQEDFLQLVATIFQTGQKDLVPLCIQLLENLQSQEAIQLLKHYRSKVGSPLVREYCNLALFRLGEEGPYREQLVQWVRGQRFQDLIIFRPLIPLDWRNRKHSFSLTPRESSRLLVDAVEALAKQHDEESVDLLVDLMIEGNPLNRYALAGLLVRTFE